MQLAEINRFRIRDPTPKFVSYKVSAKTFEFHPSGISCAPDAVVVTDTLNHRLVFFRKYPEPYFLESCFSFGSQGKAAGRFNLPSGICVQPITNHLIVSELANHRLQVLSVNANTANVQSEQPMLTPLFMIGAGNEDSDRGSQKLGELHTPSGVCCNRSGGMIVADASNHRLQIYDCKGVFLRQVGSNPGFDPTYAEDGFWCPSDVALEPTRTLGLPSRRLIVADQRNERLSLWDPDGNQHITNVEVEGEALCVCVDLNGYILVGSDNHTIQIFDPINLKLLQVIGTPDKVSKEPGRFHWPRGLCVDDDNNLYVCDSSNHRLQVF